MSVLLLVLAAACGGRSAQPRYVYYPLTGASPPTSLAEAAPPDTAAADTSDDPVPVDYVDARPAANRTSRGPAPAPPAAQSFGPPGSIGRVEIPKVGMSQPMFEGIGLDVLADGPGHWQGTAMPGDNGNTVVAGHRVTHTHPFLDIDFLQPGDQVIFTTTGGRFVYAVTESFIVTPDATWIANPTPDATMTLFACHPKHEKSHRYVVVGHLVAAQRTAPPPPPPAPAHPAPPPPPPPPPPPAHQAPPQPATTTTAPAYDRCRSWLCWG